MSLVAHLVVEGYDAVHQVWWPPLNHGIAISLKADHLEQCDLCQRKYTGGTIHRLRHREPDPNNRFDWLYAGAVADALIEP